MTGRFELRGHANQWYRRALEEIPRVGTEVTTRGRTTWEVLHATTVLPDPRKRVLTVPNRRANPFFQAMETVWLLAGRSDAGWICRYNSQLRQFLDAGEHFHGAYGQRLRRWGSWHGQPDRIDGLKGLPSNDQLDSVVDQLSADPNSRRAAVVIRNPDWDNPYTDTKDMPCNLACTYQLRDGRLWAATFNRSNDLNLGLAFTNIVQFTTIQEYLACALGVNVGEYTHFSSSL